MVGQSEAEAIFNAARKAVLAKLPDAWAIMCTAALRVERTGRAVIVHREVDLIDLRLAGDVLRREVLESGRTLFQADPEKVLAWEASALTRYGHYREEVRGILEDFRLTGIGYGA